MTSRHIDYLTSGSDDYGYRGPGWYFWDETGSYCYGPFANERIAELNLIEYAKTI